MNFDSMQKYLIFKNKRAVELRYVQTELGDYIAFANFQHEEAMGVCRDANLEYAKEQCVIRLFTIVPNSK